ncbi:heterogeneous nuclear ribonucleoprotein A1 [Clupea harengus]|uniref:Heterogeneous nuclear ribonucleoprotein A1 n=1 Tax=Clupea harengus TaxID=7950 RepID=A0A6P8G316_CLUHA|nr:heterogeneous nuclear ribonucleoprotein A1 [Clupea harengus]
MDSRVYICVPKQYMEKLNNMGQWDHGLFVRRMNPYVSKEALESHFEQWGTVLFCEVKSESTSGFPRGLGCVCFSSEEEADAAEAAGPHKLGGMEVDIRRVVMPKTIDNMAYVPHRRSGMAYRLASSSWLDCQ